MPVPAYQDLITPSSTANGLIAESLQERIVSLMAMLAGGTAPDGTPIPLGGGGGGSGTVTSVSSSTGITITGNPNVSPVVAISAAYQALIAAAVPNTVLPNGSGVGQVPIWVPGSAAYVPAQIVYTTGGPYTLATLPAAAVTAGMFVYCTDNNGTWVFSTGVSYLQQNPIQAVSVEHNGTLVAAEQNLNLIDGTNVTLTVADNPGNNRVDVTIAASGGGATLTPLSATLGSNSTLTSNAANSVLTLSLTAGTWIIGANIMFFATTTAGGFDAYLTYSGTSSTSNLGSGTCHPQTSAATNGFTIGLTGLLVATGSGTLTLNAFPQSTVSGGRAAFQSGINSQGGATTLTALKVA
jgi:hypothetical protein